MFGISRINYSQRSLFQSLAHYQQQYGSQDEQSSPCCIFIRLSEGTSLVVKMILVVSSMDMNTINSVKNRKKNNNFQSMESTTSNDSTYSDYFIADLTVLITSKNMRKRVQFPSSSSLRHHNNNNIDNFNDIELWSNQEMDQLIFRTILDANAHRLWMRRIALFNRSAPSLTAASSHKSIETKAGDS